jgi:alpha-amylase/alpha-mannosidase (GH57 family)
MSASNVLRVVLCWHMHQPQYRDLVRDTYRLPWTYLHAIKDYIDMAAHLENQPDMKAVVNFAPVLLDQIDDYARMVESARKEGTAIRDPLLAALADPVLPGERGERESLIAACGRANEHRMIQRFPAYQRLHELAQHFCQMPHGLDYVDDQFIADLLVWYHLAWLGETVRRNDPRVRELMDKGSRYTIHERLGLLEIIGEILTSIVPRYRALAERGQIELAMSPYAHPIVPLMLEMGCAQEAMPEAPMPALQDYPNGEARARWHMERGINCFKKHFGFQPRGCWPSEGSVSDATARLMEEFGFSWIATGESVLHNSVSALGKDLAETERHYLFQPHHIDDGEIACFFRDDRLSDQIGFVFSDWAANDAVANLVHHLENIADSFSSRSPGVVSIILDGENAWEHYPENGFHFLSELYQALATNPKLRPTTFAECLDEKLETNRLPHLVPGSWVYGTFSTWIGERDKNRGWDMLGDAKHAFDEAVASGLEGEHLETADQQLAVCEGSDWFWWFGGENPAETVSDFDRLYRAHLTHLYQILHQEPPEYLSHPFTTGGGTPLHGGTMKPGQAKS